MKDERVLIAVLIAFLLAYVLLTRAYGEERFQVYAWLSEKQNAESERWYHQDRKLWAFLFTDGAARIEITKEQIERLERWRKDSPELFKLMLNNAHKIVLGPRISV